MNPQFVAIVSQLEHKYQLLMAMEPFIAERVPKSDLKGGIYLFSENSLPLYAGRTKRFLSERIREHFGAGKDCPLAWLMAREHTGHRATYQIKGSRKELLKDTTFRTVYGQSKERIRKMQVRYVGESDPLRQALLEIYTAIASGAKYNDFGTH